MIYYSLVFPFLGAIAVSLMSFAAIFFIRKDNENDIRKLINFAAGVMLSTAFLHLLPDAIDDKSISNPSAYILIFILLFIIIEKIIQWKHYRSVVHHEVHSFGYTSLIGSALHNFLDGVALYIAFEKGLALGLAMLFVVAVHELPHEIADFAILLKAGFERSKAVTYNFISQLTCVFGVVITYFLLSGESSFEVYFVLLAAANFIYISLSDLLPEVKKQKVSGSELILFCWFLAGIVSMYLLTLVE